MNATYVQRGEYIDFIPENDLKSGDVVVLGGLALVSKLDVKAGTLGALATTGVYDIAKGGEAFAAGDRVYWDAAGARAVREGGAALGVPRSACASWTPTSRRRPSASSCAAAEEPSPPPAAGRKAEDREAPRPSRPRPSPM